MPCSDLGPPIPPEGAHDHPAARAACEALKALDAAGLLHLASTESQAWLAAHKAEEAKRLTTCPKCHGSGSHRHYLNAIYVMCEQCRGYGRVLW